MVLMEIFYCVGFEILGPFYMGKSEAKNSPGLLRVLNGNFC